MAFNIEKPPVKPCRNLSKVIYKNLETSLFKNKAGVCWDTVNE